VSVMLFAGGGPRLALELWRDGRLATTIRLAASEAPGPLVRPVALSPDGTEVAVGSGGPVPGVAVYDTRTGQRLLRETRSQGLAWSPDGAWLALSTGDHIVVSGPVRSAPAYVLPVEATALAWR
jgi:WD40 repeat protein